MTLAQQRLNGDAQNRAWRTFLTGLAIDVMVGIALVLGSTFATADGWGDLQWTIISFSVAKSFIQSACSYILRRFLDPSKFPTPLPPEDPGPPAEDVFPTPPITALEGDQPEPDPVEQGEVDPTLLGHGPEVVKAVAKRQPRKAVITEKVEARKAPAKKAAPRKKTL